MEDSKLLIREIVEAKRSIISIDSKDIEDAFRDGGTIHGFTVSVNPALDYRTEVLLDEVREKAELFKPFNHAIVFFFISDISPLTMDELYPLNDWLEEFPDEFMLRWGMAINPPDAPHTLKAIVLLQKNESKDEQKEET
jgi:hypothetical protein